MIVIINILLRNGVYTPSSDTSCVIYERKLECLDNCGCGWCQYDSIDDAGKCYSSDGRICTQDRLIIDHDAHCDEAYQKYAEDIRVGVWMLIISFLNFIVVPAILAGLIEIITKYRQRKRKDFIELL